MTRITDTKAALSADLEKVQHELDEASTANEELRKLVCDLSGDLTDEGANYSGDGLHDMRRRVANALPKAECPEWLLDYRDADVIQLRPGHRD